MKVFVLAASLLAVVSARPGVHELATSGSYLPAGGGSSILSGGVSGGGFDSGFGINGGGIGGGGIAGGTIVSDIAGGGILGGGFNGIAGGGSGYSQDQRHIYFYAAPDDEGPARLRINIAPSAHRNTKIIFVKAPSSGGIVPEVIAPPSSAEDKTLVYVLVKKQDHGGAITIPSSLGVKQAKPEVYFIKYRNQHEAEQAVQGGLSGQSVGDGLSDLGNEGAFVRTLSTGGHGGIGGGNFLGGGGVGGGDFGGSSILGGLSGGGTRYGTPGASGPYKR